MDQTSNEAEEEAIQKKEKPGSNVCPDGYEWEEMPIDANRPQMSAAAAPAQQYFEKAVSVRDNSRGPDTRTSSDFAILRDQSQAQWGPTEKEFYQKTGKYPGFWDVLSMEVYVELGPSFKVGKLKKTVADRLHAILRTVAYIRAVTEAESTRKPWSTSMCKNKKTGQRELCAMGLMQVVESGVKKYIAHQNPYDPYWAIKAGFSEILDKSDDHGGKRQDVIVAYNAGSGNLRDINARRAPGQDIKEFLRTSPLWQENGPRMATYAGKVETLHDIYMRDHAWFNTVLQRPEFRYLWDDLEEDLPEFGLRKP